MTRRDCRGAWLTAQPGLVMKSTRRAPCRRPRNAALPRAGATPTDVYARARRRNLPSWRCGGISRTRAREAVAMAICGIFGSGKPLNAASVGASDRFDSLECAPVRTRAPRHSGDRPWRRRRRQHHVLRAPRSRPRRCRRRRARLADAPGPRRRSMSAMAPSRGDLPSRGIARRRTAARSCVLCPRCMAGART